MNDWSTRLWNKIQTLHRQDAIHIKRGFQLSQATAADCSNHLLEEAVELQAEVLVDNREGMIEEAADVLALFYHLLIRQGIDIDDVAEYSIKKLAKTFSIKPEAIIAKQPGVTRRGR